MKRIILLISFCIFTTGCTTPAYGAHNFRKVANTASWLGAWAGFYYIFDKYTSLDEGVSHAKTYLYYETQDQEQTEPIITSFVHDIAKRQGLENPENVKVYVRQEDWGNAAARKCRKHEEIEITRPYINGLTKTIKSKHSTTFYRNENELQLSSEEYLDLNRAMNSHEVAHIQNNDIKRDAIAGIALPYVSLLPVLFKPVGKVLLTRSGILAAGLWASVASKLAYYKMLRMHEFQADDAITVPSEMAAELKYYRFYTEEPAKDFNGYVKYTYNSLLRTHPTNLERAKRYERRLQKYEVSSRVQE